MDVILEIADVMVCLVYWYISLKTWALAIKPFRSSTTQINTYQDVIFRRKEIEIQHRDMLCFQIHLRQWERCINGLYHTDTAKIQAWKAREKHL